MIITLPMMIAGLGIGSSYASNFVKDPTLRRNLAALGMGISAGTQLAGAFAPASTGMKIAGGKLGDLGESKGMINPKGFGAFEGALPEGISGAFGGKNTLPESLGGAFKSPVWNAPESIFNPPGEMKPFDLNLFR